MCTLCRLCSAPLDPALCTLYRTGTGSGTRTALRDRACANALYAVPYAYRVRSVRALALYGALGIKKIGDQITALHDHVEATTPDETPDHALYVPYHHGVETGVMLTLATDRRGTLALCTLLPRV